MNYQTQKGATALFIVIFSTLLLSVITVSFVSLINRDKVQSTDNELSQSAYDAALAGVEDAKRVVSACMSGNSTACQALESDSCQTIYESQVIASSNTDETLIQSVSGAGEDINQAYTCVKASLDSDDVLYELPVDQSFMIPIRASGSVRTIKIEWQRPADAGISEPLNNSHDGECSGTQLLCKIADWGNVPSILRTQLITPGNQVNLSNLDDTNRGATLFLYPNTQLLGSADQEFAQASAPRYTSGASGDSLKSVTSCSNSRFIAGYACAADIRLSSTIPANNRLSFIKISSLYRGASIRVSLMNAAGDRVSFRQVQPIVDSTGRANDVFRRVEARLSTLADATYPYGPVDITGPDSSSGSLCKNFFVTSSTSGNNDGLDCTP